MKFEDIYTIKLPEKYANKFCNLLNDEYGIGPIPGVTHSGDVEGFVRKSLENAYKETAEYLLADNPRTKAVAAYQGPPGNTKAKILGMWLQVVDSMTKVEQALAGIDL